MSRLALLVGSVIAFTACYENNPESAQCAAQPTLEGCTPVTGGSCKADPDCGVNAMLPACDTGAGVCVQCTATNHAACTDGKPHCDDRRCAAGCVDSSECSGDNVCLPTGECGSAGVVIHVKTQGSGDGSCGSAGNPCSLQAALGKAKSTKSVIKIDDAGPYSGNFALDTDPQATPLTIDAGSAVFTASASMAIFTINNEKGLVLLGGVVQNAPGVEVIRCTMGTLGIHRTVIRDNAGLAINSNGCKLSITRSMFTRNASGGIRMVDGDFEIVGNVFIGNGEPSGSPLQSISLSSFAARPSSRFEFNTIAANKAARSDTGGLGCDVTGFTATNNIVWNNIATTATGMSAQTSGSCQHTFSSIGPLGIANNSNADPKLTTDGHLMTGSPALGAANPAATLTGVALRDLDGDLRTLVAGRGPDVGADQLSR